jgi:hypothetical protein
MDKDSLIAWLQKLPGNPEVILAADAEGNSFSALDEPCEGFVPKYYDGGRTDDVFSEGDLTDEADPDEAVLEKFKRVIVLYPY